MRAFQFVEWQKPGDLREVPVPEPGLGQVLVKIGGAGACHSDLHIMEMQKPAARSFKLPFTLGHENAGWVEKLGPGATGFAPGDPVIVFGPWGCGLCMNCRMGMERIIVRRPEVQPPVAWASTMVEWLPINSSQRRAFWFHWGTSIPAMLLH